MEFQVGKVVNTKKINGSIAHTYGYKVICSKCGQAIVVNECSNKFIAKVKLALKMIGHCIKCKGGN